MPGKSAKAFLKKHPPFTLLDDRALDGLVGSLTMRVYPAGAHVLRQGDPSGRDLHIIREGTVRLYARAPSGEEQLIDFRSEGDTFGFLSSDDTGPLDASVQAVSDTVCFVLEGAAARKLLEEHPALLDYLLPPYFPKRDTAASDPPPFVQDLLHEGSEKALYTTPVEHLAQPDVVTLGAGAPVIEAARLMSTRRVGALIVTGPGDVPVGIVTTTDLRDRVLVAAKDHGAPVGEIMSRPLLSVAPGDFCFEALLKMMSHGVHHLPVMEGGRLLGIVSNHDLMILQGTSPLVIAREIEGQTTVEGLAASSRRIKGLVSLLLREGAGAGGVLRVISAVNDRLEHRVLDLALATLGSPPLPLCWIVYGSAGRKEQTFRTDQDNAIVHADPRTAGEERDAQEYFGRFAGFVVDAFLRCGFSRCRGNFMATNPRWRGPLGAWKRRFTDWVHEPGGAAIHEALNLFDFRGLHGDLRLAAELKAHLALELGQQRLFLRAVAREAVAYRPPLGLFGSLTLEKEGEHASQLDIKRGCLTPLVNVVRLFAFEGNVAETSTLERLAVLKGAHPVARLVADDLAHAFEFLSLLRLRHQHEQILSGREPDNFIDPRRLSSLEMRSIKAICHLIAKLLDGVARKYEGGAQL